MSNNGSHSRLLEALEYLRNNGKARTQQEIAAVMGVKQPNVSAALRGDEERLTKGFLKRFASAYSDFISADYLIDGIGQLPRPAKNTRPHIPMKVAAGFTGVAITAVPESDVEHKHLIDYLPTYDFTIGVEGDSMEPMLQADDILACHRLDSYHDAKAKDIYVIETTDGAVVKQIAHIAAQGVTAHSLNKKYPDYIIPLPSIISISRVVGLIRSNLQTL